MTSISNGKEFTKLNDKCISPHLKPTDGFKKIGAPSLSVYSVPEIKDGQRVEITLSAMTTIIMAGKSPNQDLTNFYITEPKQTDPTMVPTQPETSAHQDTHFLW